MVDEDIFTPEERAQWVAMAAATWDRSRYTDRERRCGVLRRHGADDGGAIFNLLSGGRVYELRGLIGKRRWHRVRAADLLDGEFYIWRPPAEIERFMIDSVTYRITPAHYPHTYRYCATNV